MKRYTFYELTEAKNVLTRIGETLLVSELTKFDNKQLTKINNA